ncbi:hypothetical protein ACFL3S_08955 [Gemmatimonadota bacterium]
MERVGDWYHEPTDEIYPFWRYEGLMQDLEILHQIGRYFANDGERPSLNPETPFNAPQRVYDQLYGDSVGTDS